MKKRNIFICYFLLLMLTPTFFACVSTPVYEGGGYRISQPPSYGFEGPPDVIPLPYTNDVYVVPDINVDIFFWNGWWWRPWDGRWYRSNYYDRGWAYYNGIPSFYYKVDPDWRGYYRNHNWHGHRWNYERIPNKRLRQDWESWHNNRYWEKQRNWDVQGYQPQQQREEFKHQRPEQYQQRQPEFQQQREEQLQHQQEEYKHQRQEQYQQRQPEYQQRKEEQLQPQGEELRHQRKEQYQQKQPEIQQQQKYEQERKQQHPQPGEHENHDEGHGHNYEQRDQDNQEYEQGR